MTGSLLLDAVLWTVGLTVLFEGVTVVFRFGFKLEATRDTAKYVARWTRGIRIHHGYWGVPLALIGAGMLLAPAAPGAPGIGIAFWMLVLGLALIKSDLIHHFLVLWPITGSHDFHLRYPSHPRNPRHPRRDPFVPDPIPVPASGSR
ncbi:MAG: hypothetical protein AAGA29_06930 [Planctomycetota bacterium]